MEVLSSVPDKNQCMDWAECVKAAVDFFSYAGIAFQKRDWRVIRKNARSGVEACKLGQQVNSLKRALSARETAGKNKQNDHSHPIGMG